MPESGEPGRRLVEQLGPERSTGQKRALTENGGAGAGPKGLGATGPTRRDVMKAAAGAALAGPVMAQGKPRFFTPAEFLLADELTELVIPADEHSPGARAAQCAAYIDARLAEAFESEPRQLWREGLARIDVLSSEMHGKPFLQASAGQRAAVLLRISKNEADPKTPEELFFTELKTRAAEAYYSSKVGIHAEMEYKGNVPIEEFAGYDAKTGTLGQEGKS